VADLQILELNKLIICISVGVVFREDLKGFTVAVLGNEPSRGLRYPPEANELDCWKKALEETRNAPAPVVVDKEEAERHDSRDNSTPEPDGLEEVGNVGAMLGVGDLRGQWWSGCLGES
jgi:hypothetical protein